MKQELKHFAITIKARNADDGDLFPRFIISSRADGATVAGRLSRMLIALGLCKCEISRVRITDWEERASDEPT